MSQQFKDGHVQVSLQSPEGAEAELTERSKMHCLDQETFLAVLSDAWHRRAPQSGIDDKADVVLMTPVESLLLLVPYRFHIIPYAGLERAGWDPVKGNQEQEQKHSMEPMAPSSALRQPWARPCRWRRPHMHAQCASDKVRLVS